MPFTSFLHDSHQRAELPAQWRLSLVSGNPPAQIKDKFKNIPAQVPGCVHLDLLRHNLMPDPFFGLNEKDVAWIAECDWEYKCNFSLPTEPVQTDGQIRKQFVFEGLDTFAEIQIDGKVLGDSANMFVPHRFELPENLAEGEHELRIVFRSPVNEVEHLTKMRGRVPDAFGGNRGWARKAGYSFGWDWGPILPTSGIWRPAYIQSWDLGRIAWFSSHFELVEKGGQLSLRIGVNTEIKGEFQLEIKLNDEEKSIEKTINFESGADKAETIVESKIDISNPNLWWANGTGKPNLYNLSIVLLHEGKETHKISEQIGLRTVEWVQEDDKWGKSFYVRLNGKNIFAKGANWIPADSFLPRVKSHHYEILLNAAVKANMNMVRVWGGGIYEDQEFYRIADKLGIMIWQDFPYACALYPDDEEFYSNAREEAISAVAELARHPSIVLWCGNNEIERDTDSLKSENQVSLSCESLWNDILPVALANIDPYAAYIPSSPTGGDIANASEIGDRHVWSVWSGWKHEKEYLNENGRFISEFGFQAIPDFETISSVLSPDSFHPQSQEMEWHNKQIEGPERIIKFLASNHKLTDDFKRFIRLSQDVQGRALSLALEHWRASMPETMGTLIWQLNDCWQVVSWSLIDYYMRPKASYYHVKRAFSSRCVTLLENGNSVELFLINDEDESWSGEIKLQALDLIETDVVKSENIIFKAAPNSSHLLKSFNHEEWLNKPYRQFLVAKVLEHDIDNHPLNSFWFAKPFKHLSLPEPDITVIPDERDGQPGLRIKTKTAAFGVWLWDEENPDLMMSDNAFDLVDGEERWVATTSSLDGRPLIASKPCVWNI